MSLYQFATRSRMHGFFVSCCFSLFDLLVMTIIFQEQWSIFRGFIIAVSVATLLQLSGSYNNKRKDFVKAQHPANQEDATMPDALTPISLRKKQDEHTTFVNRPSAQFTKH